MNIIGIDPSLTSTAMIINDKIFLYTPLYCSTNKKGDLTKWYDMCNPYITYRFTDYILDNNYSKSEIEKLISYDIIAEKIIEDIDSNLDETFDGNIVGIEGYSYSSSVGPLIDLVTFSTILRKKIYDKVTSNIYIYAPTSLKKLSAELTYPLDKKGTARNFNDISGGKFKKCDMMESIKDNETFNDRWSNFIKNNYETLKANKNVPKPVDDINDAYLLSKVVKKNHNL